MKEAAAEVGERVLLSHNNPISIAMTLHGLAQARHAESAAASPGDADPLPEAGGDPPEHTQSDAAALPPASSADKSGRSWADQAAGCDGGEPQMPETPRGSSDQPCSKDEQRQVTWFGAMLWQRRCAALLCVLHWLSCKLQMGACCVALIQVCECTTCASSHQVCRCMRH